MGAREVGSSRSVLIGESCLYAEPSDAVSLPGMKCRLCSKTMLCMISAVLPCAQLALKDCLISLLLINVYGKRE